MMDDEILPPEPFEKGEKKKKKKKEEKEQERAEKDKMAVERTMLAYERTLLSWLRTATSLLTFGFAIYKLLEEKRASKPGYYPIMEYIPPKTVGLIMIGSGFIGLTLAMIRYIEVLKRYNTYTPKIYRSAVMIQAYVILSLSLLLIVGAVFGKQG